MKKHLLFFSNLYPNPTYPNQATFNYQQVQALSTQFDVSILAPVPWKDRAELKAAIRNSSSEVGPVYPAYWYTPGIFRAFYGQMMLASVAATANKLHRKRPFDIVLGAWLYPDGWAAGKLARQWNTPFYLKVHGTDVNRLSPNGALTMASLKTISASSGVICVSRALKDRLVSLGVSPEKCHVVYNGINKDLFYPLNRGECRAKLGLSSCAQIILYVGNLKKTKGLEELAVAFTRMAEVHSDLYLVVVGVGPYEARMREVLGKAGVLEKVLFAGSVNHRQMGLWVNAADLFCLPSYMEGVPNAVLESLACDIPVVATAVGGVPELALSDDRITLACPKDALSLQASLELALRRPPPRLKRLDIQSWEENAKRVSSILLNQS